MNCHSGWRFDPRSHRNLRKEISRRIPTLDWQTFRWRSWISSLARKTFRQRKSRQRKQNLHVGPIEKSCPTIPMEPHAKEPIPMEPTLSSFFEFWRDKRFSISYWGRIFSENSFINCVSYINNNSSSGDKLCTYSSSLNTRSDKLWSAFYYVCIMKGENPYLHK